MTSWFKLHPKIKIQAFAAGAIVIVDLVNQATNTYPHATWLPLLTTFGLLAVGYLKASTSKDAV